VICCLIQFSLAHTREPGYCQPDSKKDFAWPEPDPKEASSNKSHNISISAARLGYMQRSNYAHYN
jgi:hypothetical protein